MFEREIIRLIEKEVEERNKKEGRWAMSAQDMDEAADEELKKLARFIVNEFYRRR